MKIIIRIQYFGFHCDKNKYNEFDKNGEIIEK